MNERWGLVFRVDTTALKTISQSARHLEKVAESISTVRSSLNKTVNDFGKQTLLQIEAIKTQVDALKKSQEMLQKSGVLNARVGGGSGGGRNKHVRNQEVFAREQLGMTQAQWRQYRHANIAGKDEATQKKMQRPPGGWFPELGKVIDGVRKLNRTQLDGMVLRANVAVPIAGEVAKVGKDTNDIKQTTDKILNEIRKLTAKIESGSIQSPPSVKGILNTEKRSKTTSSAKEFADQGIGALPPPTSRQPRMTKKERDAQQLAASKSIVEQANALLIKPKRSPFNYIGDLATKNKTKQLSHTGIQHGKYDDNRVVRGMGGDSPLTNYKILNQYVNIDAMADAALGNRRQKLDKVPNLTALFDDVIKSHAQTGSVDSKSKSFQLLTKELTGMFSGVRDLGDVVDHLQMILSNRTQAEGFRKKLSEFQSAKQIQVDAYNKEQILRPDLIRSSRRVISNASGVGPNENAIARLEFIVEKFIKEGVLAGRVGAPGNLKPGQVSAGAYITGDRWKDVLQMQKQLFDIDPLSRHIVKTGKDGQKTTSPYPLQTEVRDTADRHLLKLIENQNKLILRKLGTNTGQASLFDGQVHGMSVDQYLGERFKTNKNPSPMAGIVGRVAAYGGTSMAMFGALEHVKSQFGGMKDYEQQIINIRKVLNPLGSDLEMLSVQAKAMGQEFGVSITKVAEGMQIFAQQGMGMADILSQTRTAVLATNVTELSLVEATEALTAAQRQFNMSTSQSLSVLDAWNEVENTTAVNTRVLTEALKRAGTASRVAGVDFHLFNGVVAAMGEATRKSGDTIGTSLKFIFQHARDSKAIESLQSIGIFSEDAAGNMKSARSLFTDLNKKWDGLTDAQRQNVAVSVAGTRHLNDFFVMMETWDRAIDISISSLTSQGSAMRENDIAMQSLNKKLDELSSSYSSLWATIGESGAIDVLKQMVDLTNNLLGGVNKLTGAFGGVGGRFAGILGVAGVGMATASYLGGGVMPDVMFGNRGGTNGKPGAPNGMASLGGGGGWFNRSRMYGIGTYVGASFLSSSYNRMTDREHRTQGKGPSKMDTAVDLATTGAATYAGYQAFLPRGGFKSAGKGRKALLAAILAAGASQGYDTVKQYTSAADPTSVRGNTNRLNALRYQEEKYGSTISSINMFARGYKNKSAGGNIDVERLNDIRDTVAAIAPSLVEFDSDGLVVIGNTTKELEKWADGLRQLETGLRRQRTEAIKAVLNGSVNQDEFKKAVEQRAELLKKRSGMTEANSTIEDRIALESELTKIRTKIQTEGVNNYRAAAMSFGTSQSGLFAFSNEERKARAKDFGMSENDLGIIELESAIEGSTQLMVDARKLLGDFSGNVADVVAGFRTSATGDVLNTRTGSAMTPEAIAAATAAGKKILDISQEQGFRGIAYTDDANLSTIMESLNRTMDRLIAKNDELIRSTDLVIRSREMAAFASDPTSFEFSRERANSLLAEQATLAMLNNKRSLNFENPLSIDGKLSTANAASRIRMLQGQLEISGSSQRGLDLQSAAELMPRSMMLARSVQDTMRPYVQQLIAAGGEVVGMQTDSEDPESASMKRYFEEIIKFAGEANADQIRSLATEIGREVKAGPAGDADKITLLTEEINQLLASASQGMSIQVGQRAAGAIDTQAGLLQANSVRSLDFLGKRFAFMRDSGRVSSFSEFQQTDEYQQVARGLKTNNQILTDARDSVAGIIEEFVRTSPGATAEIEIMRDKLSVLNAAAEVTGSSVVNMGDHVRRASEEMARAAETNRMIADAGRGQAFGLSGINEQQFAIESLEAEMKKLNDAIGSGSLNQQERLDAESRNKALLSEKNDRENQIKEMQAQRRALTQGLRQGVFSDRLSSSMGLNGGSNAEAFVAAAEQSFREYAEKIAQIASGASPGKSTDQMMSEIRDIMGDVGGPIRDLIAASDKSFQKDYLLASPGTRALADRVREQIAGGAKAEDLLADPRMRSIARENPLIGQLIDKALGNDMADAAMKFQENTADNTLRAAVANEKILAIFEKYGVPVPNVPTPPGMSSGSMALSGTAAVNSRGQIRRNGTPAMLHEGEIVLTKQQSEALLRNQYAKGTTNGKVIGDRTFEFPAFKLDLGAADAGLKATNGIGEELLREVANRFIMTAEEIGLSKDQARLLVRNIAPMQGKFDKGNIAAAMLGKFHKEGSGMLKGKMVRSPYAQVSPLVNFSRALDPSNNKQASIDDLFALSRHEYGHILDQTMSPWYGPDGSATRTLSDAQKRAIDLQWHAVLSEPGMDKIRADIRRRYSGGKGSIGGRKIDLFKEFGTNKQWRYTHEGVGALSEFKSGIIEHNTRNGLPIPDWIKNTNKFSFETAHRSLPMWGRKYDVEGFYGRLDADMIGLSSHLEKMGFDSQFHGGDITDDMITKGVAGPARPQRMGKLAWMMNKKNWRNLELATYERLIKGGVKAQRKWNKAKPRIGQGAKSLRGVGNFGLMAGMFMGDPIAEHFGMGDTWRVATDPVFNIAGSAGAFNQGKTGEVLGLTRGAKWLGQKTRATDLLKFGRESIRGTAVTRMAQKLPFARFANNAGGKLGMAKMFGTKIAGKALGVATAWDSAIDVNRLYNWGAEKTGWIDKNRKRERNELLDQLGDMASFSTSVGMGYRWTKGYGSGLKSAMGLGDGTDYRAMKELQDVHSRTNALMRRNGAYFIDRIMANPFHNSTLTEFMGNAEGNMQRMMGTAAMREGLDTPLVLWSGGFHDYLQKMSSRGSNAGAGNTSPLQYAVEQRELLDLSLSQMEPSAKRFRDILMGNGTTVPNGPEKEALNTVMAQIADLQRQRDQWNGVIQKGASGEQVKDIFAVMGASANITAMDQGARGLDSKIHHQSWADFGPELMALSQTDPEGIRHLMAQGAQKALLAYNGGEVGKDQLDLLRQYAEVAGGMPVTSTFRDLSKLAGFSVFERTKIDGQTLRREVGATGMFSPNVAGSLESALKNVKDRAATGDVSSAVQSMLSIVSGSDGLNGILQDAASGSLSGVLGAYRNNHPLLSQGMDSLMQRIKYEYKTGADPKMIDDRLAIFNAEFGNIDSTYREMNAAYGDLSMAEKTAHELWAGLPKSLRSRYVKNGDFNLWSQIQQDAPVGMDGLSSKHSSLTAWVAQATRDRSEWQEALVAQANLQSAQQSNRNANRYATLQHTMGINPATGEGFTAARRSDGSYVPLSSEAGAALMQQIKSDREAWQSKQFKSEAGLRELRNGLIGGGITTMDQFWSTMEKADPSLAQMYRQVRAIDEAIGSQRAMPTSAVVDRDLLNLQAQRERMLESTGYKASDVDTINNLRASLNDRLSTEARYKEALASGRMKIVMDSTTVDRAAERAKSAADWNARQNIDMSSFTPVRDSGGRAGGRHTTIYSDGSEWVLPASSVEMFRQGTRDLMSMTQGQNSFDGFGIDARQFAGPDGVSSNVEHTHNGEIQLRADMDMMDILTQCLTLLKSQQGGGQQSFKQGDLIQPRYAR